MSLKDKPPNYAVALVNLEEVSIEIRGDDQIVYLIRENWGQLDLTFAEVSAIVEAFEKVKRAMEVFNNYQALERARWIIGDGTINPYNELIAGVAPVIGGAKGQCSIEVYHCKCGEIHHLSTQGDVDMFMKHAGPILQSNPHDMRRAPRL